jgi:hypothetical protein
MKFRRLSDLTYIDFITVLEARKSKTKVPTWPLSSRVKTSSCLVDSCLLTKSSWQEGENKIFSVSSYKGSNPIMSVPPSWPHLTPNYLLKTPSPQTIMLGLRVSIHNYFPFKSPFKGIKHFEVVIFFLSQRLTSPHLLPCLRFCEILFSGHIFLFLHCTGPLHDLSSTGFSHLLPHFVILLETLTSLILIIWPYLDRTVSLSSTFFYFSSKMWVDNSWIGALSGVDSVFFLLPLIEDLFCLRHFWESFVLSRMAPWGMALSFLLVDRHSLFAPIWSMERPWVHFCSCCV